MSMNSFHSRGRRPRAEGSPRAAAARPQGRVRADQLLTESGLAESRSMARRLIEAGRVTADGEPVRKPSVELASSAQLAVAADAEDRFVSRGGIKLAGALSGCGVDPSGMVCLDVGQSTGGFTDCLLQGGAARVVGVEVGHGQLHPRLAGDRRVICLEGINARTLVAADLGDAWPAAGFDLIVCDASFISLTLLLPRWPSLLSARGQVVALVKPQFEVGPQGLAKGGIVRDASRYDAVETRIRESATQAGLAVDAYFDSAITGGDGNREFFIHASRASCPDAAGNTT
ncbi:MAG: TlyA family RNA methyltransferase [Rhodocyclaceae bacterium]|nr:TlyA family RNA methyltransferase [Rhodocyclaceae bacterium]